MGGKVKLFSLVKPGGSGYCSLKKWFPVLKHMGTSAVVGYDLVTESVSCE